MKVKAFSASLIHTLEQKLEELIDDDFSPNLAFVFASVDIGLEKVLEVLKKYPMLVFGASTCGEIFFDGNRETEGIYNNSVAVSLVEMNREHFDLKLFDGKGISSFDLGAKIGLWGKEIFDVPGFLVAVGGIGSNGQEIVEGIQKHTGRETPIFGGLAGDDSKFEQTFVFNSKKVMTHAAVAVVFDTKKINMKGLATSGWVGIGSDKTVTKAKGNIVYTIDDEPALKVYKDHLNIRDKDLPEIGVEYPLMIKKDGKEILRAVNGVNREEQSLVFAGTVPEGSTVTFSTSPGFEVVDHTKADISDFFDRYGSGSLLILFSCMARHKALGPIIIEEILTAFEKAKAPITGFFTLGEIGMMADKSCEFFNETFTLVVISEKNIKD
ncbi:MAG: hypothetical protein B6D64_14820 [Bacteroidetes bacterium 4484_276]|nr:MAG: hypothetical protein B6D64_14820 [Bacteroidetes bacterium 4484_276]